MAGSKPIDRRSGPTSARMFIGLHWPSQPWGEETIGAAAAFGTAGAPAIADALLEAAVEHFGGGERGPRIRSK